MEWRPGGRVAAVTVPRVVVTGSLDAFTGGPNAVRVAQAMGCELIVMEGVGHGPMVEAPDRFCEILFDRVRAPAA